MKSQDYEYDFEGKLYKNVEQNHNTPVSSKMGNKYRIIYTG